MKKNILIFMMGVIITSGIVYATDMLIPAASISFESEHTDKTNVADALNEIFENQQGSLVCPDGYTCQFDANEYLVTYDANGGNVEKNSYNVMYDHTYWLPIPTREGYAFGGWFLDENLTKYVSSETKLKIEKDHTLYAAWGTPITLTFDSDGGSVSNATKIVALNGRYGILPSGYKEGYVLEGWYSDSALTNKVNENTIVSDNQDHMLYAKWILGNKPLLYDVIASKNKGILPASAFKTISGSGNTSDKNTTNDSSNTKGVWTYNGLTSSDGGTFPIYYFRGPITDNNVLFAGYCWKIIRTTGTGGTKLIYNGVPNNSKSCDGSSPTIGSVKFNSVGSSFYNSYYSYSNDYLHGVGNDSNIKKYIEKTWFENSFFKGENNEYYNLLEDTPFCTDRRYATSANSTNILNSTTYAGTMFYASYIRQYQHWMPSLDCYHVNNVDTDKLSVSGGQLNKKIGMINGDEVVLAGSAGYDGKYQYNYNYYLYTGTKWWNLSPSYFSGSASVFIMYLEGYLNNNSGVLVDIGVRPVVSLSHNAKILGGNGSSSMPFTIES